MKKAEQHSEAVKLFQSQHSLLHSSSMTYTTDVTLEDAVLKDLDEESFRKYPVTNPDTKNSIVWHLWHITRIEDISMNILVANDQQVLNARNWLEKMNIDYTHSGNDMSQKDIAKLSSNINLHSLLAYRASVGKQTQRVISSLEPGQFKMQVDPARVNRLFDENAVMQNSKWLADYWSKKDIAGLILMPATRHIFFHLNKCIRIKDKLNRKKG
ncbi:DinB family protein [Bacillus sp. JCM 19034]|uniref:DinB family protein n=1 Tax=Bacillus sp. JCM 19034 TaxID=1481928 RepID=UPI000A4749DC|nr:DinB family protein [Bacillus sp. JCM 19034]